MRVPAVQKRFFLKHQKNNEIIKKKFDWVALTYVVSVCVPILYVMGRVYDESYLNVYGISNELFPRETQEYLYYALLSILQVTFSAISSAEWDRAIVWALVIPIYVGFLFWLNALKLSDRARTKIRSVITTKAARIVGILSTGPIVVGVGILFCFGLLIVILIPIAIGLQAGKQVAADEIKNDAGVCARKNRDLSKACTVVLENGKELMTGRIVAAGDSYVAVAAEGQVRIFRKDNIALMSQR